MTTPAGRGTIFDRTGVQLAIGEQDDDRLRRPAPGQRRAQRSRSRRSTSSAPTRTSSTRSSSDKNSRFVYVARFADPKAANAFLAKHFTGIGSYPEERRAYPQNTVAAPGDRLRGHRQQGPRRARARVRPASSPVSPGSRRSSATPRAGDRHDQLDARAPGPDLFTTIDSRIQANAEAVLRQTVTQFGAQVRERDRARPDAPARSSRWRRRPSTTRTTRGRPLFDCSGTARSPTRTSPARRSSS